MPSCLCERWTSQHLWKSKIGTDHSVLLHGWQSSPKKPHIRLPLEQVCSVNKACTASGVISNICLKQFTQSNKQHANTQNQLCPKSWILYPLVTLGYGCRSCSVSCRYGKVFFIWENASFIPLPWHVNNPAALWPLGHHPIGKRQHNVFQASSVLCPTGLINKHMPSTRPDVITDRTPTAGFTLPLSPARAASFPEEQPVFMASVE